MTIPFSLVIRLCPSFHSQELRCLKWKRAIEVLEGSGRVVYEGGIQCEYKKTNWVVLNIATEWYDHWRNEPGILIVLFSLPSSIPWVPCPSHGLCEAFNKKGKKWSGNKWSEEIKVTGHNCPPNIYSYWNKKKNNHTLLAANAPKHFLCSPHIKMPWSTSCGEEPHSNMEYDLRLMLFLELLHGALLLEVIERLC